MKLFRVLPDGTLRPMMPTTGPAAYVELTEPGDALRFEDDTVLIAITLDRRDGEPIVRVAATNIESPIVPPL